MGKTFVEKIFGATVGSIVFRQPDIVLSHDNTASIQKTFRKMNGVRLFDPGRIMVTLDHNAPPTHSKLANDYQEIRLFVKENGILRFHDAGNGICHQLMVRYARPGMIITGSDSHTCTAGALNAFATGIDRTETAGIWKTGETWFRVPDTLKITLTGRLPTNVSAKDLALFIIGTIGSDGADYLSVEFHGDGVSTLTVDDRLTIANMASEMGAKNAVFPPDEVLREFLAEPFEGIWADPDANYKSELAINLDDLYPVVACPHNVDNIKPVSEVAGTPIGQALVGTCTNGRLSDLREAARILKGRRVFPGVQLLIIPASREIYLKAIREGILETLVAAGGIILSPSCGPCLGTGQGIPADGVNVISTANRNFAGRMGNNKASIYLASPATVALSALQGCIVSPCPEIRTHFPVPKRQNQLPRISSGENRRVNSVWAYQDVDNLNTDQMFAGNLTYEISSAEPEKIVPHLFTGIDAGFAGNVKAGDILVCGANFGCGSSREHPAVGLVHAGVKAVLVKSVSRIFFRAAINQGLPVIVVPSAVEAFRPGNNVQIIPEKGLVMVEAKAYAFTPLPEKLIEILNKGGLINALK
jgi:3-isopropylmalate/(R)-2-methylmalate dehydratase large subunit